jgi:hypothetical protein
MSRSAPASTATPLVRRAKSFGVAVAEHLQDLTRLLINPYRPELYYMRGPGPKWRAKHSLARQPR